MTFFRDLGLLLRYAGFRRLFAVRLFSQASDGIFQVALASTILFSPERAPSAGAMAAGFAVLLLPFSILGPFAGVLLDRWPRRRVMILSNLVRAGLLLPVAALLAGRQVGLLFLLLVLAAFSVNRFLLAGLSASLPHVVGRGMLVTANAVSPTCGTLAYLSGLAIGGAIHGLTGSDPVVVVVGSGTYLAAALLALALPFLGPDLAGADVAVREAVGRVLGGLLDAVRHLPREARIALAVVAASRLPYGVMIVGTILLYRNHFESVNVGAGLAGLGTAVAASGVGYATAAVVTPTLTRRLGFGRYIVLLSLAAAVAQVFPAALFTRWAVVVTAVVLGAAAQGVKICADTIIQSVVPDVYRGRVFSLYDVLFNLVFVGATALAAVVLPADGRSYAVLGAAALWYLLIALAFARLWAARARVPDVPHR